MPRIKLKNNVNIYFFLGTFVYLPHPPIYNPDKPLSKWCPGMYKQ